MKPSFKIALALGIVATPLLLTGCFEDKRGPGEKIDDAAKDLKEGRGVGNAAEELKNKTPGERVGDAIEDAGHEIKKESK